MSKEILSERQVQVLRELESACRFNAGRLVTPLECGGTDGSHHSATLAQLCKKGLAMRRKSGPIGDCSCRCGPEAMFGHKCRGSFGYRITVEGLALLERMK